MPAPFAAWTEPPTVLAMSEDMPGNASVVPRELRRK
jgi:hypothetical protein